MKFRELDEKYGELLGSVAVLGPIIAFLLYIEEITWYGIFLSMLSIASLFGICLTELAIFNQGMGVFQRPYFKIFLCSSFAGIGSLALITYLESFSNLKILYFGIAFVTILLTIQRVIRGFHA